MIKIRIIKKLVINIDEVNEMLKEGEWELEVIFKGVNKEIYFLKKYEEDEKDIIKKFKEERTKSIFSTIGEFTVLIFILSIVISLILLYKGEIPIK
ncbi:MULTISPECIES: hypothetical protein [Fusobacterium]|uniref:hypothetical protein n=1 Tax=Fusobacterium TaxID=848 RepID=UPI003009C803